MVKIMTILQNVEEYIKKPYNENMSMIGWFLFLGLILIFIFIWYTILDLIKKVTK
jgi:hypothetical protein